jgi:hypothetical protein
MQLRGISVAGSYYLYCLHSPVYLCSHITTTIYICLTVLLASNLGRLAYKGFACCEDMHANPRSVRGDSCTKWRAVRQHIVNPVRFF